MFKGRICVRLLSVRIGAFGLAHAARRANLRIVADLDQKAISEQGKVDCPDKGFLFIATGLLLAVTRLAQRRRVQESSRVPAEPAA